MQWWMWGVSKGGEATMTPRLLTWTVKEEEFYVNSDDGDSG